MVMVKLSLSSSLESIISIKSCTCGVRLSVSSIVKSISSPIRLYENEQIKKYDE